MGEVASTPLRKLHLDYETFSTLDLTKVGHYRYAEDPSTEILMAAYAFDDGPVKIWVPAEGEAMPLDLQMGLNDPSTEVKAWNAAFERQITANKLPHGRALAAPSRFRCTMVECMSIGLPAKLEVAGEAIGLPEDQAKMKEGKRLVQKFCKPRKPSKKNPATRWGPDNAPEDWATFKAYCIRDVEAERRIFQKTSTWRMPEVEHRLWVIDQEINDRGIQVDMDLVLAAVRMGEHHRERCIARVQELTGLVNPNSRDQLITWLNSTPDFDPEEDQDEVQNLQKKTVEKILGREDLSDLVREVLELRQQIAKASLKKYDTFIRATCKDGRIRGTMQFGGASRTMRWAGRLLQVQNLPQGCIEDVRLLAMARELVLVGDYEGVEFIFGNVPEVLATLIRTCLIGGPGRHVAAADFSAIEARVTAWFANCQWRLEVFRTHGKIYEASAAMAFKVPLPEILDYKKRTGKHHPLRKKGKVMELALGYQGGENAMITMGALDQGIPREELLPMVEAWRDANTEVAGRRNEDGYREGGLWQRVEQAAKRCLKTGKRQELACGEGLRSKLVFRYAGGMLIITLPSGRHMHYFKARLKSKGRRTQIVYWGIHQKTKKWCELETYGGKLVENIVQAFSRDCLREAMFKLHDLGYDMTMLVHDEIVFDLLVAEIEAGRISLEEILGVMAEEIPYAPGLPLKGDGFINPFYFKG